MSRVRMLDPEDLPEADKDILERPINLYRALAHVPELARRYRAMGRWIRFEGSLDPRLRELVILQVGLITGNAYESSHHIHVGKEFGLSDQDIVDLLAETRGEPNSLSAIERTLVRAARELTLTTRICDETWSELRGSMSDPELVELSVLIGYYNMTIRIIEAVQLDVEDDYLEYFDRLPGLSPDRVK